MYYQLLSILLTLFYYVPGAPADYCVHTSYDTACVRNSTLFLFSRRSCTDSMAVSLTVVHEYGGGKAAYYSQTNLQKDDMKIKHIDDTNFGYTLAMHPHITGPDEKNILHVQVYMVECVNGSSCNMTDESRVFESYYPLNDQKCNTQSARQPLTASTCTHLSRTGDYSILCHFESQALVLLTDFCSIPYTEVAVLFNLRGNSHEVVRYTETVNHTFAAGSEVELVMSKINKYNDATVKVQMFNNNSFADIADIDFPTRRGTICPESSLPTCTSTSTTEIICRSNYSTPRAVPFSVSVKLQGVCSAAVHLSALVNITAGTSSFVRTLQNGVISQQKNYLRLGTSLMLLGGMHLVGAVTGYLPVSGGVVSLEVHNDTAENYQVTVWRHYPGKDDMFPLFRKDFQISRKDLCTTENKNTSTSTSSSRRVLAIVVTVVVSVIAVAIVTFLLWRQYSKPVGYRGAGGLPAQMEQELDDDFSPDVNDGGGYPMRP